VVKNQKCRKQHFSEKPEIRQFMLVKVYCTEYTPDHKTVYVKKQQQKSH